MLHDVVSEIKQLIITKKQQKKQQQQNNHSTFIQRHGIDQR